MKDDNETTVGDSTRVRLGLLITLVGFCCLGAWWAATMKAKVDTLIEFTAKYQAAKEADALVITRIEARIEKVEWRLNAVEAKPK